MTRRRSLTGDEAALWRKAMRRTRRFPSASDPAQPAATAPVPDPAAAPPSRRMKAASVLPARPEPPPVRPPVTFDLAGSVGERLAREPVRMDTNTHAKMMRGKLEPEARIDLHGMTLAQAWPALSSFILQAHARGLRLVLVITGKGRTLPADDLGPVPRRAGALKNEVPHWLRSGLLAPLVMELREAHRSHGGAGAYYVYLRRRR